MNDLPDELIGEIMDYLCVADMLHFNSVSKRHSRIIGNSDDFIIGRYKKIPERYYEVTRLFLGKCVLIPDGITKLSKLKKLDLGKTENMDDDTLVLMKELTLLRLGNNRNVTNYAIARLTKLETLSLGKSHQIRDIALSKLPNLTSLDCAHNCHITKEYIATRKELRELYVGTNRYIDDNCIKELVNLRVLSLGACYQVTDAGIKGLTELTSLCLSTTWRGGENVTDNSIECFTNKSLSC